MAAADLKFVQLRVTTQELNENRRWVQVDPPRRELVVATQSGRTRVIPLDSKDMALLLTQAATIVGSQLNEEAKR